MGMKKDGEGVLLFFVFFFCFFWGERLLKAEC